VIAAVQFSLFVAVQQLMPYNARVFIDFSASEPRWDDGGSYDPLQQLAFACAGIAITYFRYCVIDVTSGRMFGITPSYVGTCHIAQYPRFRRTIITVSTHVVTDIYVGRELFKLSCIQLFCPLCWQLFDLTNCDGRSHSVVRFHSWSADGL
jgi:hypothetical protein